MHSLHVRQPLSLLPVALVLVLATALSQSEPAAAQNGGLPCSGMLNLVEGKIDPTLQLRGDASVSARAKQHPDGQVGDEVQLSWTVEAGSPKCIWIQRRLPGEEYPSFAVFVLQPTEVSRVDAPAGIPGEYCYRIFAVSDVGRSEPAERCVNITTPLRAGVFDGPPQAPDTGAGNPSGDSRRLGLRLAGLSAALAGLLILVWPRIRRSVRLQP